MAEQTTTQKPTPAPAKKGPLPAHLAKAHATRSAKALAREGMTEAQKAHEDVRSAVRKVADRLTRRKGCLRNRCATYRALLTDTQKAAVMEYLEAEVQKVKDALYVASDDTTAFDL